ncbi:MAG: N-acetyltransferase family protein [Oxalicibacterium faecigallinarum]|uniref:GNAT family N-acetyltransferase n=1 Tax=Oxalicibacterium faecigallinarum TaxID=573741 RepID=UPI0028083911|nr:N-acetyltransferase family protein [Oxalicibacterium faecigallinarum]MDQ7968639.1 N-acetyltransferase family protein [Oxalicibacterium faecigallinarum]
MAITAAQTRFTHRAATVDDLPAIVAIYNSTIASREVTADLEPVTIASRMAWFASHAAADRPIWVAERDGVILGWLSFSDFHPRAAYRHTAELSIYVHESARRQGLASYLLTQAIAVAPSLNVHTLIGLIFGHNQRSLGLFARFGFVPWGHLPEVALLDGVERDLIMVGKRVA